MNGWLEHDNYKIRMIGWFLDLILPKWVKAITLAPFGIYVRGIVSQSIIDHEEIHWQQQIGMLIIFFYIWYLFEWLVKLIKYGGQAYRNISFERAAYASDKGKYSWIKYL